MSTLTHEEKFLSNVIGLIEEITEYIQKTNLDPSGGLLKSLDIYRNMLGDVDSPGIIKKTALIEDFIKSIEEKSSYGSTYRELYDQGKYSIIFDILIQKFTKSQNNSNVNLTGLSYDKLSNDDKETINMYVKSMVIQADKYKKLHNL